MKERLEELRRALSEATPGPWRARQASWARRSGLPTAGWEVTSLTPQEEWDGPDESYFYAERLDQRDAEFIVAARNSLPGLLSVAEAAAALIETLEPLERDLWQSQEEAAVSLRVVLEELGKEDERHA